jgi:hypothetical protein
MRKFVQCGKYFRSHAVPPYTSFTVLAEGARILIQICTSKNVHVCYRGCCVIALETGLEVSGRRLQASRKYQKQISRISYRNVLMTQLKNSMDFSRMKHCLLLGIYKG